MKTITFTNIVKKVFFSALILPSSYFFAQENEEKKKFSFDGSVDAYYRYNFNGPNKNEEGAVLAPPTSFANDPGFALGFVNLIGSYEGEKVGFTADLVFGPRGEDAVFLSEGSSNIVNQLYVYWNLNDKLKLTFGNFNTFLGYEVISPTDNFNYSTSYMFSFGPFSHTGLKADILLSEKWSLMLGILNATDFTEFNPAEQYSLGTQLSYTTEKGAAYLNFIYGKQGPVDTDDATFQADLTAGVDLNEDVYLGINTTYNTTDGDGFYGIALYPQYKTSESFSLGLRAEYFNTFFEDNNVEDENVIAFTLTGSYTVEDLTIKPELRLDSASSDIFTDPDLVASNNLASFLIAAIYSF
ncbi:outer membrane beta-barrel protein [Leptobacterium flavescens]|uniref:Outer membrane beta-barrel protein n=1 Tax=Leptobacterium flavescens TaxID=472055 RepID=A0A6P0USC4_9FLAO|nr:porin [Leptobacterium flavescens]NER15442.1 outer membrane beta-barrel protein [Leptobacterium flavescens]